MSRCPPLVARWCLRSRHPRCSPLWDGLIDASKSFQGESGAPAIILMLIVSGLTIAALGSADRRWILLLSVPVYALSVQSILHTEPRYTVGIWYFLLIFAGVAIAAIAKRISQLMPGRSKMVSNCF